MLLPTCGRFLSIVSSVSKGERTRERLLGAADRRIQARRGGGSRHQGDRRCGRRLARDVLLPLPDQGARPRRTGTARRGTHRRRADPVLRRVAVAARGAEEDRRRHPGTGAAPRQLPVQGLSRTAFLGGPATGGGVGQASGDRRRRRASAAGARQGRDSVRRRTALQRTVLPGRALCPAAHAACEWTGARPGARPVRREPRSME